MIIEYKKDLRHNYLVITDESLHVEDYSTKVLEYQKLEGFLMMNQRIMDNKTYLYYDISSKQSMSVLYEKARLSYEMIKNMFKQIFIIIQTAYEYLLSENDFILEPEYIYFDLSTNRLALCYFPGFDRNLKDQIVLFLEYLMNKVDYNDKEAVLLVYRLYASSKEDGYTIEHLIQTATNKKSNYSTPNVQDEAKTKQEILSEGHKEIVDNYNENINDNDKFMMRSEEAIKMRALDKAQKNINNNSDNKLDNNKIMSSRKHESYSIKNIPVMPEKLESEKEVLYYPLKTYLLTGVSVLVCSALFIGFLISGILYNSFGNRPDTTKLLAVILILICSESYLLKLIWDKKNKLSKIVTYHEYVDPRGISQTVGENNWNIIDQKSTVFEQNQTDLRKTQMEEKKSYSKLKQSFELTEHSDNIYQSEENLQSDPIPKIFQKSISNTMKNSNKDNNISIFDEDNPTYLLNPTQEESRDEGESGCIDTHETEILLKPEDDTLNEPIILNAIPFFVGKVKQNVDYCLENDAISRYHAKIFKEENQFYITDLNSTNGTFVNGEVLMPYQKKELHIEDEVMFANIKYRMVQV